MKDVETIILLKKFAENVCALALLDVRHLVVKPLDLILIDVVDGLYPQAGKVYALMDEGRDIELGECTECEELLVVLLHLL